MAFKMTGKSPLMKKLIGKQKNLPEELKAKILAAPESPAKMYDKSPAKEYGESPAKNYKNPQDYKVFNMGNEPTPMKQVKPTDKDMKKYSDYEKYDEDGKKITRKQKREIKKEFKAAKKAGAPGTGKKKSPMKGYKSDAQRKAVHASKADGGKGAPNKMSHGKSPAKQGMKKMSAADKKKLQMLSDRSETKSIKGMTQAEKKKAGLDKKLGKSPAKQGMKKVTKADKERIKKLKPLDPNTLPKKLKDHKVPVARMGGARTKSPNKKYKK